MEQVNFKEEQKKLYKTSTKTKRTGVIMLVTMEFMMHFSEIRNKV